MPDDKKPEDDEKPEDKKRDEGKREPNHKGYEKLETTAIYTEVSIAQLKAIHAKSHPAEKRKRIDPGGDSSTGGV